MTEGRDGKDSLIPLRYRPEKLSLKAPVLRFQSKGQDIIPMVPSFPFQQKAESGQS